MLAFIRDENTASSVQEIFEELYHLLGTDEFQNLFPVILADNGTEFSGPTAIEFDSTDNRRILPKGTSFDNLTQLDINLMMNHLTNLTFP